MTNRFCNGLIRFIRVVAFPIAVLGMQTAAQALTLVWQAEVDTRGRAGTIESAEFSEDGRYIVSGTGDGHVQLWHVADGEMVWESRYWDGSIEDDRGEVEAVYFSPDGQFIAAGGNSDGVKIYRVSTGELVTNLGGDGSDGLAFSPNGEYLAAPDKDEVRMFAPDTWELHYEDHIAHDCDVNSIDFSRDSRYVVTGSCDKTVRISRTADGSLVREIEAAKRRGSVKSVRLSPDGKLIATGNGRENVVKVFRVEDGDRLVKLDHDGVNVETVAFSPDGRYLATGGGDVEDDGPNEHTIFRLYSLPDFELVDQITAHAEGVEYLDFSADSRYLLTAGEDGILKLWQLEDEPGPNLMGVATAIGGVGLVGAVGAIAHRRFKRAA
jgi:WD40 repeat protein